MENEPRLSSPTHFHDAAAPQLGRAIALGSRVGGAQPWTADEIAAIFRHELAAPLHAVLGKMEPVQDALMLRRLGDLLGDPAAPIDVLRSVKDVAKASLEDADSALPREVSAALYWLCIASALALRGERLSTVADDALRQGLRWTLGRSWMSGGHARVLRAALAAIPVTGPG
jgi:hypothetical protein